MSKQRILEAIDLADSLNEDAQNYRTLRELKMMLRTIAKNMEDAS